jgi:hypothetical protein
LARIILSHALLESIRFVMSRKERRDIYGLINNPAGRGKSAWLREPVRFTPTVGTSRVTSSSNGALSIGLQP